MISDKIKKIQLRLALSQHFHAMYIVYFDNGEFVRYLSRRTNAWNHAKQLLIYNNKYYNIESNIICFYREDLVKTSRVGKSRYLT